jgi:hypothetical protein
VTLGLKPSTLRSRMVKLGIQRQAAQKVLEERTSPGV